MFSIDHIQGIHLHGLEAFEPGVILGYSLAFQSSRPLIVVVNGDVTFAMVAAANNLVRRKVLMCPGEFIELYENYLTNGRKQRYTLSASGILMASIIHSKHIESIKLDRADTNFHLARLRKIRNLLWPLVKPHLRSPTYDPTPI